MSHHLYYEAEELITYNLIPTGDDSVQYEQVDVHALETGDYGCECGEQFENEEQATDHLEEARTGS